MHLQTKLQQQNTYDAIVIGSGISGGMAAKELCEKGLKTLVLERGRNVKHIEDYPTSMSNPWDFDHRGKMPLEDKKENPIVNKCYAYEKATEHFFVKDKEHPYIQEKPFDWIRGYQVGGKSLIWARQTQRWSDFEFEGPARDGFAVDWPIRYKDLAPWYSHVERFAGISGNKDGIDSLPDGEFLKPWELNCLEKHIQKSVKETYADRKVIIGRCAHLTDPQEHHLASGRSACQARHLCYRGCPYGAYFSSNSSSLPTAMATGNLTLRPDAVVTEIIYDDQKGKATGVRIIDRISKEEFVYHARIIFVNAACLNTNLLLLNSKSSRFPNGLGNDNGLLGKYIAFHQYRGQGLASFDGFEDQYYFGRRPTSAFIPSFRNLRKQEMDFQRGYMVAFSASRSKGVQSPESFGASLKESAGEVGPWHVFIQMQGETIPKESNHVRLSDEKKDDWGVPQLITSIAYDENDNKMMRDFQEQASEMLTNAGCHSINMYDSKQNPGVDIHEMGGVRMGRDSKTSLLNEWNQLHSCKNVFVTDGACMTSVGNQNPSLTFMALTARAIDYATKSMNKADL
ncbi:GMC oxidoreductase [Jiulongibacter sp. NS-SX5]|uniref:GMC oxidoreductase n=1 Tax=Jiulongibacter sp. NS-SX5 TaxID=3463854 RepID=UPI004058710C